MSVADSIRYVSDMDPAKTKVWVHVNPDDPESPKNEVEKIEADATIFHLGALDVFLMGHIYDNASSLTGREGSDEVGIHTRVQQTNLETVRFGLKGWENFKAADGSDLKYTTTKLNKNGRSYVTASDEVLNALGVQLIQELAGKIKELSTVSKAQSKN